MATCGTLCSNNRGQHDQIPDNLNSCYFPLLFVQYFIRLTAALLLKLLRVPTAPTMDEIGDRVLRALRLSKDYWNNDQLENISMASFEIPWSGRNFFERARGCLKEILDLSLL
jgi:hypothetical protein